MSKFKTEIKGLSVMGASKVLFFTNGELETECEVAIAACQNIDGVDEVEVVEVEPEEETVEEVTEEADGKGKGKKDAGSK